MRCRICNFRARFTLIHDKPDATRGLPRSARATRIARTLPFRRWYIICVCSPSRSTTDHTPFWIGPVKRFGPVSLTTVRRQFRCLSPAIQPSASANAFIAHTRSSREDCVPPKGRLHQRSAFHKTVTSPAKLLWLRDADISVRSEDPPNNCSYGLRRSAELTPYFRMCLIRLFLCNPLRVANLASFVVASTVGLVTTRLAT
jgi:hypothetical protein